MGDAVAFARRCDAARLALFHHDPTHDDARLDVIAAEAGETWAARGGDAQGLVAAREGEALEL